MPETLRDARVVATPAMPTGEAGRRLSPSLAPRLFFLHIMKTAGTTLCSFLEQHYHVEQFPPHKAGLLLRAASASQGLRKKDVDATAVFDRYDYLCAHTNFLSVLPASFRFITLLREPEARLRSLFRHWQQFTDEELKRSPASEDVNELKRAARSLTLEEFLALDKRSIFRNFNNGMTRTLVENFPVARENKLTDRQLVAEAKRAVDQAFCVGMMERFDDFLNVLCWRCGWPAPQSLAELNVRSVHGGVRISDSRVRASDLETTPPKSEIRTSNPDLPSIVEDAIRLDREVYAHAAEVFEQQHRAMLHDLIGDEGQSDADERTRAAVNCAIDERARRALVAAADHQSPPPREVTIDMSGAFRGGGWLERESHGAAAAEGGGHRYYRWTGPAARSSIDMLLEPRAAHEVEIKVAGALDESILRGTRLFANDAPLQEQGVRASAMGRVVNRLVPARLRISSRRIGRALRSVSSASIIRGNIPAGAVGSDGFVRLTIQTPRTVAPADLDPKNADRRRRGLAIESIRIARIR